MPSYSPPWAPHVTGSYGEREFEEANDGTMQLVPIRIDMSCSLCNATHRHVCPSGAVHQWIQRFALAHVHRDPMRAGPQGGST